MTREEKYARRLAAAGLDAPLTTFGGRINFKRLTAEAARELINSGCADEGDNTNGSPTFGEITAFLERNPSFVAHGYIIIPTRGDERITLEGVIAAKDPGEMEVKEFVKMFREADDFDLDCYRAWYD
jgi:hypothetical protein